MLLLAALVLTGAAWLRSAEYDEQYTLFLTAGVARPVWPDTPFTAGAVQLLQAGHASLAGLARDLRRTDVHPPLYFWAAALWRRAVGPSLFATRLLSVVFGLVGLAAVGGIAARTGIPPVPAMVLTLGCYGFAYTAAIARGYALAQALTLCGVLVLLGRRSGRSSFVAGLLLGAAAATDYLAVFVGAAVLAERGWRTLSCGMPRACRIPRGRPVSTPFPPLAGRRRGEGSCVHAAVPRWSARPLPPPPSRDGRRRCPAGPLSLLPALSGFAPWLVLDLWFFLAQRGSRVGQFPPFHLPDALRRLATYAAANLFGGLPLYAHGTARAVTGAALAGLLLALAALVARRWRHLGHSGTRPVLLAGAAAPPLGLLLLGAGFDTTPIELRYLAFATPFAALLLAGALAGLPHRTRVPLTAIVLSIQAVALAGLLTRPETMQPARATAQAAARLAGDGLVLVPRGNDGVGIVGAFGIEAPSGLRLRVVAAAESPAGVRRSLAGSHRVVVASLAQDAASRAALPHMLAALTGPCWQQIAAGPHAVAFRRICVAPEPDRRTAAGDGHGRPAPGPSAVRP